MLRPILLRPSLHLAPTTSTTIRDHQCTNQILSLTLPTRPTINLGPTDFRTTDSPHRFPRDSTRTDSWVNRTW